MKCKIIRENGVVTKVLDNNQNESKLFKNLNKAFENSEHALDYYLAAVDSGMETGSVADAVLLVDAYRNTSKELDYEQLESLSNVPKFQGMDLSNIWESLRKSYYPKGVFKPTKFSLRKLGIYSEGEISNILGNRKILLDIKDSLDNLQGHVIRGDNAILESVDLSEYKDFGTVDSFGRYQSIPFKDIDILFSEGMGLSKESFDEFMGNFPVDSIRQEYFSNKDSENRLFERYSKMRKSRIYKVDKATLLKGSSSKFVTFSETVSGGSYSRKVSDYTNFLQEIPSDLWEDVQGDIQAMLEKLEKVSAREYNLDIVGITSTLGKGRQEVLEFVETLNAFTTQLDKGQVSDSDLLSMHRYLMGLKSEQEETHVVGSVRPDNLDKLLVHVENPTGDFDMFQKFRLVRTSEGLYHKVSEQSLEELTQTALINLTNNPTLYPTLQGIELDDIQEASKEIIRRVMTNANTSQKGLAARYYLTKLLLNHPMNPIVPTKESVEYRASLINISQKELNYLTTDFVMDLQQYILQGKLENSGEYKTVLKNLRIGENSIQYLGNKTVLNKFIGSGEIGMNMAKYALIQKHPNLSEKIRYLQKPTSSRKFERAYHANHPNSVDRIGVSYNLEGNSLVTPIIKDSFVRTSEGVWELSKTVGNKNIYTPLVSVEEDFVQYLEPPRVVSDYLEEKPQGFKPSTSITKRYTSNEVEGINSKIDECI